MKSLANCLNEALNEAGFDTRDITTILNKIEGVKSYKLIKRLENILLFSNTLNKVNDTNYRTILTNYRDLAMFYSSIPYASKLKDKNVQQIIEIGNKQVNDIAYNLEMILDSVSLGDEIVEAFHNKIYTPALRNYFNWNDNSFSIFLTKNKNNSIVMKLEDHNYDAQLSTRKDFIKELCLKNGFGCKIEDNSPGTSIFITFK